MDNSLLVSLSQQLAAYRSMDVIANNLANASTPGFKRETAKFEEFITHVAPSEGQTGQQAVSFVKDAGISRDISQGGLQTTGAPLDLAINGNGFFTVQTSAGMRYTRDGHFTLDQNGQVVDSDGNALQGDGGAITITPDDQNVHVAQDGTLSSTVNGLNNPIAKVQLVDFADLRRPDQAGLQSLFHQPGAADRGCRQHQPGRAGNLQCPAGAGNQPHDRSDARLSGDRDAQPESGRFNPPGDRQAWRDAQLGD